MGKNARNIYIAILSIIGLAAVLYGAYGIVAIQLYSALGPMDPESLILPSVFAVIGAVTLFVTFRFLRSARQITKSLFAVIFLIPSTIIGAYACVISFLVLGEPLYRETKVLTLDVQCRFDQERQMVVYKFVGYGEYWYALQRQPGLQAHIESLGEKSVPLTIKAMYKEGKVTRYFVKDLAGHKLKRQPTSGYYLPDYLGGDAHGNT